MGKIQEWLNTLSPHTIVDELKKLSQARVLKMTEIWDGETTDSPLFHETVFERAGPGLGDLLTGVCNSARRELYESTTPDS